MKRGDKPESSPDSKAAEEVRKTLDGAESNGMRDLKREARKMRDVSGGDEERRRAYEARQLSAKAKEIGAKPGPENVGFHRDSHANRIEPAGEKQKPGTFEPRGLKDRSFSMNELVRDVRKRQSTMERTGTSVQETGERHVRPTEIPVSPERRGEQRLFKDGEVLRRYPAKDSSTYQLNALNDTGNSWDVQARRVERLKPKDYNKQVFDLEDLAKGRDRRVGDSVGVCRMEIDKDPLTGKRTAEICDINIPNQRDRRQGHGSEMLRRAERDARDRGATKIWAKPGMMAEPGQDSPNLDRDALQKYFEKHKYRWNAGQFEKDLQPES
jgi:hypothetical protein